MTTVRDTQTYRVATTGDTFEVEISHSSFAMLWDRTFSHALVAAHAYVTSTHLVPPDGTRPHRLVVTVAGELTWKMVEEMEATVRRAWAKEMAE